MVASKLYVFVVRLYRTLDVWMWLCLAAVMACGAAVIGWITSSLLPLTLVALLVALVSLIATQVEAQDLAAGSRFLAKLGYPPKPITMMYKFWIELSDRAWDTLQLRSEERATVESHPSQPVGFVVEKWGESLVRWRVQERVSGRVLERTIDHHGRSGYEIVMVWEVKLGAELGAARVELAWRNIAGREALTFAAFGGRFGGWLGPIGDTEPSPDHTLFRIPMPLDIPSAKTVARKEFDDSMARYRMRGEQAWVAAGEDAKRLGCDVYSCDELKGMGFSWCLVRHDLRPSFPARVASVDSAPGTPEVGQILVRLVDTGQMHWAGLEAVEADDKGRNIPACGEWVVVVFDDQLKEADRIWLLGHPKQNE